MEDRHGNRPVLLGSFERVLRRLTFWKAIWILIAAVVVALIGPVPWASAQDAFEPTISHGTPMSRHKISGCPLGADY